MTVLAKHVLIGSLKFQHVLPGTYDDQHDAYSITGRPTNLVIRNCDNGRHSEDAIQFEPGQGPWDHVLIKNSNRRTGPLPEDAEGFRKGERPGENVVDTKQKTANPRSHLTIRNGLMYGWDQPGQISNMVALKLKNLVEVQVENYRLRDNEIAFRLHYAAGMVITAGLW